MLPFAQENEWEDLCNLVVENGCLRTRNPRGSARSVYIGTQDDERVIADHLITHGEADDVCALHNGYALITRSGRLIVNGEQIRNFDDTSRKRSIVTFGRTFVLIPDGIWFQPDRDGVWSGTQGEDFPTVDFAITHANRLWACRYGTNTDGDFVNEIYVSALGDPLAFFKFEGIASDSYAVSIASPGAFTGVGATVDAVVFFKSDSVSVVYGDLPEEYTVQTYMCEGVQAGCDKSVVTLNGAIYFKSCRGVYVWSGYEPFCVSENIVGRYVNARACAAGDKYYIAMENEADETKLFVFDTSKSVWTREDADPDFGLLLMAFNNAAYIVQSLSVHIGSHLLMTLYGIQIHDVSAADPVAIRLNGSFENGTATEAPDRSQWIEDRFEAAEPVSFSARSAQIGLLTPDHKRVLTVQMRADLAKGSRLKVTALYNDGHREQVYDSAELPMRDSACIRFVPHRCDRMRLLLEGSGEITVYSITKTVEYASEVTKRA